MQKSLLTLLLCAALPASAGIFDSDALTEVAKLRAEQNTRLEKLESAAQNQLEVANELQSLKDEVAKLRGQVELLTFGQEQGTKRQKDYYVDLDTRVRKMETATADAAAAAQQQAPKTDPAAETQAFEAALTLFKDGKFKDASDAFRAFIKSYPASAFGPGAHYWGGNAHFQLREWIRAGELYDGLASKWPNDPKAADALLKLADTQQELGDAKGSRKTLESLQTQYPGTPAAVQAKQRLTKKK